MKYALNLAEDGRILSATYEKFAPVDAVLVDALPEGNIADYLYVGGEYVYDPLPAPEVEGTTEPTTEERVAALEEENTLLKAQVAAQSDQMDFYEDCIAEMAMVVYA